MMGGHDAYVLDSERVDGSSEQFDAAREDASGDLGPLDAGATYEAIETVDFESVRSCQETCVASGMTCDGQYAHPLFGPVAGVAFYDQGLGVSLSCDRVPELMAVSQVSGEDMDASTERLEAVVCWCKR